MAVGISPPIPPTLGQQPLGAPQSISGNPVLDEIDQAHASLSPPAKAAIEQAHGILGVKPADTGDAIQQQQPSLPPLNPSAMPRPVGPVMSSNEQKLQHVQNSGSGISQIHNPWARVPLQILDAVGSGLFPRIAEGIPGTEAHHQQVLGEAAGAVRGDEATKEAEARAGLQGAQTAATEAEIPLRQAQTAETLSLPELHKTQAELAGEKAANTNALGLANLAVKQGHEADTEKTNAARAEGATATRKAHLAQIGYKENEKGEIVPLEYSEMSEPMQATHDLMASRKELVDAQGALAKARTAGIPAQIDLQTQRLASAQRAHDIAEQRLELSNKQYEMRAHGTEAGVPLPGAMIDNAGQTVGTANAQNVRPTGTQRDAARRADTMLDLDARIRKALQNPEIAKGTGPLAGRLSEIQGRFGTLPHDLAELQQDLVSYGAFQAGLHPVRGIGALEYFEKKMGGMGQTPEELIGKLDSNKTTAGSVKNVGSPKTVGGEAKTTDYIENKKIYKIPAGQEKDFERDHPGAKRQ